MITGGLEGRQGAARVTAAYARALVDLLRARGIDPLGVYSRSSIEEIESPDGRSQIPLAQWLAMLESAVSATQDADLPLKVGMSIKAAHIGALGYVVMSCATLGDAISQLERYSRLVGDISDTQLRQRGRKVELVWQWAHSSSPPPAVLQLQLAARTALARWLTGRSDWIASAHFQFRRPVNAFLYDDFFGEKARFNQAETKLVFRADYREFPVVMADPAMRTAMDIQAKAVLKSLAGEPDFLRELKARLIQGLSIGRVSLAAAAQELNISERTLQRRLDGYGHSYRQVLEEVRKLQAMQYLTDRRASLANVAFMLGYSEQSTFHYAFKRWTGTTPKAFRARHSALMRPKA